MRVLVYQVLTKIKKIRKGIADSPLRSKLQPTLVLLRQELSGHDDIEVAVSSVAER